MRPIARYAAYVALMVVTGLLSSGLVTFAISGVVAMQLAPEGTEFTEAMSAFISSDTPLVLALGIVPTSLAFAIIALIVTRGRREELRFWSAPPLDFVIGSVGMIAVSTAAGALVSLLGLVDNGALAKLNDIFSNMTWDVRLLMLPVTAIGPGVSEELFFRGFVLGKGQRVVGTTAAVIISALAFGAVHVDPGHVIAASLMGGYLAFVVLRTGSLWVTIVAHVMNNALATLAPELNGTGATDRMESVIGLIAGVAVGALMVLVMVRRHPMPDRTPAPPPPPDL